MAKPQNLSENALLAVPIRTPKAEARKNNSPLHSIPTAQVMAQNHGPACPRT